MSEADIVRLIRERKAFLCFFGSALRLDGVEALLDALDRCTEQPEPTAAFGARVFKVARDAQGNRLTYMKITAAGRRRSISFASTRARSSRRSNGRSRAWSSRRQA